MIKICSLIAFFLVAVCVCGMSIVNSDFHWLPEKVLRDIADHKGILCEKSYLWNIIIWFVCIYFLKIVDILLSVSWQDDAFSGLLSGQNVKKSSTSTS